MGYKMSLPHQRSYIIDVDKWVWNIILVTFCLWIGYQWGYESNTEVRVVRIPEQVTSPCSKGALKKLLFEYRKEMK